MVLLRLAFKNARARFSHYLAYVLACALAITIFFSFNVMATTAKFLPAVAQQQRVRFALLTTSFFIVLFMAAFMLYANLFFMQQRHQEIGLFNLLGVTRWRIGLLFFLENLLLGLVSLVLGLLLGILLSKLLAMLLLRLLDITLATTLLFSWAAVGQTTSIFLVLVVILAVMDASLVYRHRLAELFRQKPPATSHISIWHYLGGGIGLLLLGYAYWSAQNYSSVVHHYLFFGSTAFMVLPLLILVAVLVGTYLFYQASLSLILQLLRRHKRFSYHGLRLVTLANLAQRLKRNGSISWLVTILTAITLTILGSMTMLYAGTQSVLNDEQPVALTVEKQLSAPVKKALVQARIPIRTTQTARLKVVSARFKLRSALALNYGAYVGPISVIRLTDYHAMQQIQPDLPALTLTEQQSVLLIRQVSNAGQASHQGRLAIQLNTPQIKKLAVKQISHVFPYGSSNYVGETGLVVSDQTYQRLAADAQTQPLAFDFAHTAKSERVSKHLAKNYGQREWQFQPTTNKANFANLHFQQLMHPVTENNANYSLPLLNVRYPRVHDLRTLFGLDAYITGFVSLIFIMATGSIIMLKQLAEAAENRSQYALLAKLGLGRHAVRQAIYSQTVVTFLLPVGLGLVNAYFALHILNVWLNQLDLTFAYIIGLVYLVVYTGYCWLTANAYYKLVQQK